MRLLHIMRRIHGMKSYMHFFFINNICFSIMTDIITHEKDTSLTETTLTEISDTSVNEDIPMIIELPDENIIFPFEISFWGCISGQFFLLNSIVLFIWNYIILAIMMAVLYVTTMFHWYKLLKKGMIRTLDMIMAVSVILRITFFDSNFMMEPAFMSLWYAYVAFSCLVFVANEYWFSHEIQKYKVVVNPTMEPTSIAQWFLSGYTQKYPSALYYNVFIHLLVLHVLPNLVSIISVITHPTNPCSVADATCVWNAFTLS